MKREISTIIMKEFDFINCLVTVSGVQVTQDLMEAKVFISVLGGNTQNVLSKLRQKRGMIQSGCSKRVVLRTTPILDFRVDDSADRGVNVISLLDEVAKLPTAPPEETEDAENAPES